MIIRKIVLAIVTLGVALVVLSMPKAKTPVTEISASQSSANQIKTEQDEDAHAGLETIYRHLKYMYDQKSYYAKTDISRINEPLYQITQSKQTPAFPKIKVKIATNKAGEASGQRIILATRSKSKTLFCLVYVESGPFQGSYDSKNDNYLSALALGCPT